jgi:hypothetical protein
MQCLLATDPKKSACAELMVVGKPKTSFLIALSFGFGEADLEVQSST